MAIPNKLRAIVERKRQEVRQLDLPALKAIVTELTPEEERSFFYAIFQNNTSPNVIAEFKRTSPSRTEKELGEFRPGADPAEIAKAYEQAGAVALSVLTDPDFNGSLDDLRRVKAATSLPVLRKDFIVDPAQIYESKVYGADAILLIASILKQEQLWDYLTLANNLNMDCLVESHNQADLEKAVKTPTVIFGINNRNLEDFTVSLDTTVDLLTPQDGKYHVPRGKPVVAESGIFSYADVEYLVGQAAKVGRKISAILVGTSLMDIEANPTIKDIQRKVYELRGKGQE